MQIQLLCLHVVAADDELSFCHKTRVDFAQFRSFGFKLHIEPLEEQRHHCWWFLGDNSPRFIVVWPLPFFEVCCIELLLVYAKIQSSGCCCCIGHGGCVLYLEQLQMYQPVAAVVFLGSSCRAPHFSTGFDGLLSNSIINGWSFNQWSTVWEATSLSSKFLEEEFEQSTLKSG